MENNIKIDTTTEFANKKSERIYYAPMAIAINGVTVTSVISVVQEESVRGCFE